MTETANFASRTIRTTARVAVTAAAVAAAATTTSTEVGRTQEPTPDNAAHWSYVESRDGLGRWLRLTAERATIETPAGRLPPEHESGRVELVIEATCREGEVPLGVVLTFPPHPDQPETTRTLSPLNLWWTVTGTTPTPHRHETRITIGTSTFETVFTRERVTYEFEPD